MVARVKSKTGQSAPRPSVTGPKTNGERRGVLASERRGVRRGRRSCACVASVHPRAHGGQDGRQGACSVASVHRLNWREKEAPIPSTPLIRASGCVVGCPAPSFPPARKALARGVQTRRRQAKVPLGQLSSRGTRAKHAVCLSVARKFVFKRRRGHLTWGPRPQGHPATGAPDGNKSKQILSAIYGRGSREATSAFQSR